jgi:hypothetical protein
MLLDERLPSEWAQLRKVAASGAGEHGRIGGSQNGWRKCSLMISPCHHPEGPLTEEEVVIRARQGTRRSPDGRQPRHD